MAALKSRWKKKGTGEIIHPETEIDQIKNGESALASCISLLLKAASTSAARSAIEAAAAAHSHTSGDITSFATSVINSIGQETLSALGVRYSITTNGYICFGDLFGGLILQWACVDSNVSGGTSDSPNATITLPISFSDTSYAINLPGMREATTGSGIVSVRIFDKYASYFRIVARLTQWWAAGDDRAQSFITLGK